MKSSLTAIHILLVALLWICGTGIAWGASDGFGTVKRVVDIFSVWGGKEPDKSLLKELSSYIDYDEMAERSLGKRWSGLDAMERRQYSFVFRKLIEDRYYPRWRKIFSRGRIEKLDESDTADSIYVKTALLLGSKEDTLVWRLSKRRGEYKIISIAVDDKDLLTRMSKRVQKQIDKNGFAKLMAWMKDRVDSENTKLIRSTATR